MRPASFLVTGATGRLGEATVRVLVERGDRLLLTGRNGKRLAELEKSYGSSGLVQTLQVDATEPDGARSAAAEAASRFDGLTGLIHLVGEFAVGPLMLTDVGTYEEVMRSNFLSAVVTTQAVLPHLGEGGRLIYFGSPLSDEPLAGLSAYAASKAALLSWMRAIAHEVKRRGVHANAIVLTLADTPEMRRERPNIDLDHTVSAELVARAVAYLTSEASDGVYGGILPVLGKFSFSSVLTGGPPPGAGAPLVASP